VTEDDLVTLPLGDLRAIEAALQYAEVHVATAQPVRDAALDALIRLRKAWRWADVEAHAR